jgi:hypothetical protein
MKSSTPSMRVCAPSSDGRPPSWGFPGLLHEAGHQGLLAVAVVLDLAHQRRDLQAVAEGVVAGLQALVVPHQDALDEVVEEQRVDLAQETREDVAVGAGQRREEPVGDPVEEKGHAPMVYPAFLLAPGSPARFPRERSRRVLGSRVAAAEAGRAEREVSRREGGAAPSGRPSRGASRPACLAPVRTAPAAREPPERAGRLAPGGGAVLGSLSPGAVGRRSCP